MGFIEDLRKQNAEKAEAQRIAEEKRRLNNLEYERKLNLYHEEQQRLEKQRPANESDYWQRAKDHFEYSGLRGMLNELVGMKAARSISEDKSNKREEWQPEYVKFKTAFTIKLDIGNAFRSLSRDGDLSITIMTNVDGDIDFSGNEEYNSWSNHDKKISKTKWENDRRVLEIELGKAYESPHVHRVKADRPSYVDESGKGSG